MSARSPPESSVSHALFLPGGWATISTPVSQITPRQRQLQPRAATAEHGGEDHAKLLVDFLVRFFEASGHGLLHLVDDILELLLGEAEVLELRLQKCRLLADALVFLQRGEIDLAETGDLVFQRFETGWRILGVELEICFSDGNIR